MSKIRRLSILLFSAIMIAALGFVPGPAQVAQAQNGTVNYNLYATDGYLELPDGQALYIYGFIGGRQNTGNGSLTYQPSCTPGKKDKITGLRSCTYPVPVAPATRNVTIPGGVPAPSGGAWTGLDIQLAGNAQYPAPIIYATKGDVVEIRLKNLGVKANPMAPNDPHSIHLHGLDVDAANDGVPETSLGAIPANLCANGTSAANGLCTAAQGGAAPGAGNVVVYMFAAKQPGTSMYHCHQEADIHVQMGMYGALVIYDQGDPAAATGPGQGMGGKLGNTAYDKDYVLLLSEFDKRGHESEEGTYQPMTWDPKPYNWALYKPQYWQVNGLSFPNTIHGNWPSGYTFNEWIAAHPGYDPLITGSVNSVNSAYRDPVTGQPTRGEKVLLRVINMGFEAHPMHMHGYHAKIIGSDQRTWKWSTDLPFDQGLEKNTLFIGSGETYEWLIDFGKQDFQSAYQAGSQSRYYDGTPACQQSLGSLGLPIPAVNTPVTNQATGCAVIPAFGQPGLTYIGGPTVTGAVGHQSTNQFFPFHNHDDYKATNNGIYPGGMFTMIVPTP